MEISGKLFTVLPEVSGEGKNGRWVKCDFVLETQEKYPKKVCLTAWSDQVELVKSLPIASDMKVQFDVDSREYNGKWYTNLKAWRIEAAAGPAARENNAAASGFRAERTLRDDAPGGREMDDDLPF
ncbi:MAG: DUF3127 domain-containing protein [Chitinophagales bacterium]